MNIGFAIEGLEPKEVDDLVAEIIMDLQDSEILVTDYWIELPEDSGKFEIGGEG